MPIAGVGDIYKARDAMLERRVEVVRRELLDRVKARVAARIERVCAHLSAGEFGDLVNRIAEIEIKYSTRRTADLFYVARGATWPASTADAAPPQERQRQSQRQ